MEQPTAAPHQPASPPDRPYQRRPLLAIGLILIIVIVLAGLIGAGQWSARRRFIGNYSGNAGSMNYANRQFGGHGPMIGHRRGPGILGSITKITGDNLTLHNSTQDLTITISPTTSIYKNHAIAKQADLTISDVISVFGTPNSNGTVTAQVITIH